MVSNRSVESGEIRLIMGQSDIATERFVSYGCLFGFDDDQTDANRLRVWRNVTASDMRRFTGE